MGLPALPGISGLALDRTVPMGRESVSRFEERSEPMRPLEPPSYIPEPDRTSRWTGNAFEAKAYFEDLCRLSLETLLESGTTLQSPQSANPTVSIILVLFNRAELTLACLRSIAEIHSLDLEVVIVDNASQDDTRQVLERSKGARIIKNDTNRHFLAGVNQSCPRVSWGIFVFS